MNQTHPVVDLYLARLNESLSTLSASDRRRSSMTFAATLRKRQPEGDRSRALSKRSAGRRPRPRLQRGTDAEPAPAHELARRLSLEGGRIDRCRQPAYTFRRDSARRRRRNAGARWPGRRGRRRRRCLRRPAAVGPDVGMAPVTVLAIGGAMMLVGLTGIFTLRRFMRFVAATWRATLPKLVA